MAPLAAIRYFHTFPSFYEGSKKINPYNYSMSLYAQSYPLKYTIKGQYEVVNRE